VIDFASCQTLGDAVERRCRERPAAHCVSIFAQGKWRPYDRASFWDAVERYALAFSNRLPAGEILLFIKRLDLDLLAAYLGAMNAGLRPAQIAWPSAKVRGEEYARKLAHVVETCRPCAIFTDASYAFAAPAGLAVLTPDIAVHASGAARIDDRSAIALAQFSSGSTGLQKGVFLSHRAVLSHMEHYANALQLTENDRLVSWLPLYHDMGLIACFLMPLLCGAPFLLMDPFDWIARPDLLLEAVETQRATLAFLPNFAYHVLAARARRRELASMRMFINCSEPARGRAHEQFAAAFGISAEKLSVCYALAENTFAVSQTSGVVPTRSVEGKAVLSCGRVIEGTSVTILDADPAGVGEIAIRGACLFSSFLDGTRPLTEDGYYRTGDLGILDAGELFVTGRKKDILIVNGKNIYPEDVEHAAATVGGLRGGRVVAFGVDNVASGSEDLIVVAEPDGSVADATALRIAIQAAIDAEVGLMPRRIELIPHGTLVKTSSGKMSRARNRELYLAGSFAKIR
jgi:fatty-acyl-CoA synthase